MFVICPACGEHHYTEDGTIAVLDCYEGEQGQDVITYVCPETGKEVSTTVYRSR